MQHGELIALALLSQGPQHPYEMNKRIEDMQARQWAKLGASTLYVVLDRLTKKGFVHKRIHRVDARPPRKVYSITPKGRTRLMQNIADGLMLPSIVYSDRIVAAVFASTCAPSAEKHFESAKAQLRATQTRLKKAAKTPSISAQGRAILVFQATVAKAEYEALEALSK